MLPAAKMETIVFRRKASQQQFHFEASFATLAALIGKAGFLFSLSLNHATAIRDGYAKTALSASQTATTFHASGISTATQPYSYS